MPHKKCLFEDGCTLIASFGYKGKGTRFCSNHKIPDMVNLICKLCSCGSSRPTYNYEGIPANYCNKCKLPEMINTNDMRCNCGRAHPCFNYAGIKAAYCMKCKLPEMFNVVDKKCQCGKFIPNFNYEGLRPKHCSLCKLPDMINVCHKQCFCKKAQPRFNFEGLSAAYCSKCRLDGMIDVNLKYDCYCGLGRAHYNYLGKKGEYCSECKQPDMINIQNKCKNKSCYSCGSKKYRYYCTPCFSHLFPNDQLSLQIRIKTKEITVRDFINSNFSGFSHDSALYTGNCDCSHRRRIDHRKLIGNTLLAIETDEHQHKRYDLEDEDIRYNDLSMIHGGKFIFIRFNPDSYKNKNNDRENPSIESRLPALYKEIEKQIARIEKEENNELLEIIYLFFDEI